VNRSLWGSRKRELSIKSVFRREKLSKKRALKKANIKEFLKWCASIRPVRRASLRKMSSCDGGGGINFIAFVLAYREEKESPITAR